MKALARSGELAVGTSIFEFVTPGIGHILAAAGCDFAFLDMEHSGFSAETVKAALRFLEAGGVPTLVRVPSRDRHDISRLADVGAEAIMVPLVGSAEVARAAADALKYPPEGRRGVALGIAHDRYRNPPTPAAGLAAANARTGLVILIETAEAVEAVEEIAAVPGVDALWIGHFDLSTSLGIPGAFEDPRFRAAIARVVAAGRAKGLGLGRLVSSSVEAEQAWRDGFRMLCWSGDVWLLQQAVAAGMTELRRLGSG
jgi:2-dehydro-3-deoxyglucarate aldolase/4-hydroxy-2-oxoheptanedioate aldolase